FGFLALPGRRATGLQLTPVSREPMPLAVHDDHRLAGRADVDLAATTDETFADGPPDFGTRVAVDRAFAAAGLQRRVALEVNDTQTLIDLVRHRLAAAFLPTSFVRDMQGITFVPVRHHTPVFETYIAEPTSRRPSAAAAALLAVAKHQARTASASTR
ncbi:MAG: hypothetical protein QOJ12_2202, partial [Thermoleophilales bacterium]|nr:hypothetical protein [Thermoleophilales bacterium]